RGKSAGTALASTTWTTQLAWPTTQEQGGPMPMELRADIRSAQTLSPRLQRAVQLLQMSSLDFAALVRQKLGENPFLESEDDAEREEAEAVSGFGTEADADEGNAAAVTGAVTDAMPEAEAWDSAQEAGEDDRDLWLHESGGLQRQASEGELSALEMSACDSTLAEHLHGQL